ncbi:MULTISPECIES: MG2 domain-containing protein [unclassified Pseudoalteromonas]|uniref:alpha-2-macroglobulin family protein n=1 Tax=unclassified Pseudoalteromonas TaxID=194690 RepID=UPI00209834C0|nr:MG2 domain-containing protein [Pseudoalteromonas sp. XMcav2-N]MCO7189743.1 MG2 domain-containing protein [Pseudoalteromonas sp. XMcav2-N]
MSGKPPFNPIAVFFLFFILLLQNAIQAQAKVMQQPKLAIVGSGPLVAKGSGQSIPITYQHIDAVDVELLRLTSAHDFLSRYYLTDKLYPSSLDRLQYTYDSVFADRFTLPKNTQPGIQSARLPIPKSLSSGWYIVVLKAPGMFNELQAKHLLLTDLGIQAKVFKQHASIQINRLSTGRPIKGAKVKAFRKHELLRETKTDQHGAVHFDIQLHRDDIVVAEYTNNGGEPEYALLPIKEVPLDLSDYQVGGRPYQDMEAYIYSNRDLVKPGETLPINILLRDADGVAITEQPVTLTVTNPLQEEILRAQLTPGAAGFFNKHLYTDQGWPTGRYKISVMLDPTARSAIGHFEFQLEEFVPERMDLTFSGQEAFVTAGKSMPLTVQGRYLFGSPAAGNALKASLVHRAVRHYPGPFADFFVGEDFYLSNRFQTLPDQRLSEQGKLALSLPTVRADMLKSPVETQVNLSLLESGGAAVQRQLSYTSWKSSPIPAIKPAQAEFKYASDAQFELALLSPDGQHLTSGELDVELSYDQGRYFWFYEEGIGWRRQSQPQWRSEAKQSVVLNQDTHTVQFPVDWGNYRLTITDKQSKVKTVYDFYAGWHRGYQQLKAKPQHLSMQLDKRHYQAGDILVVDLDAPADGQLQLALEADSVLWTQSQSVSKGNTTLRIPLDKSLARHDLYLSATLLSGQSSTLQRHFGIVPVRLSREDRELKLDLTLPDKIEPLKPLTVAIQTSDIAGSQAEQSWVTLSVVDKGILNLSRYYPVDPHHYLFNQRRYGGDVIDLYSRRYDNRPDPFAQSRFGSDSNERSDNRNDNLVESKTVILMTQPVQLIDGKASITVDMPDYNGEVQIVATAFNHAQVGHKVEARPVSAAVIAELSVPRFLVPKDETSVTLDLHNVSGREQTLSVTVQPSGPVQFVDEHTFTVTLDDQAHWSRSMRVLVGATPWSHTATMQIELQGAEISQTRSWSVPIKAIEPQLVQATTLMLTPGQTYQVGPKLWQGLHVDETDPGTLYASHTPRLPIREYASALRAYPYGCAEQTTSKAWPFLLKHPQLDGLLQQALDSEQAKAGQLDDPRTLISQSVQRLKTMQKPSGGFALWDAQGNEQPWLSAYITEFLTQAHAAFPGTVPPSMLNRAHYRMLRYTRDSTVDDLSQDAFEATAAKSFAAYLASQRGQLSYSDLESMRITEYPSRLSLLHMASALADVGAIQQAAALLRQARTFHRTADYFADYGSTLRDDAQSALVLTRLTRHTALRSQSRTLQTQLLEQLPDQALKTWLSTQERAALLRTAVHISETNAHHPVRLEIDGEQTQAPEVVSHTLSQTMTLSNPNDAPLYLQLMAKGRLQLDSSIANEISPFNTLDTKRMVRRLFDLNGQPLDTTRFKVGERLMVVLDIQTKEPVPDALLIERIPAGFVLENPALMQGPPISQLLPEHVKLATTDHTEYRNDRFVAALKLTTSKYQFAYILRAEVPGLYQVPPSYLESMYRPHKHVIYWQYPYQMEVVR